MKPILTRIQTFDATKDYTVTFSYSGYQTYKHRLVITNSDTSAVVYDETVEGFELYHIIEANSIENGSQYYAQVQCFDQNGNESQLSDGSYFRCIKTPEFRISNIKEKDIILYSSIQPILYYEETDESLKDYQFFLYSSDKIKMMESPLYYDDSMNTKFTGLEEHNKYYIQAVGETIHGLKLDTGLIGFTVSYKEPSFSNKLILNCSKNCGGYISWSTDFILINCTTPKAYKYDDTREWINLIDKQIEYNYGFLISSDFELKLIGKNLNRNGKILEMFSEECGLVLETHIINDDGDQYFHLKANNGFITYNRYTDYMKLTSDDIVEIIITRKNNMYRLSVYKK